MKKRIVAAMLGMSLVAAPCSVFAEESGLALDAFAGTEITIAVVKANEDVSEDFSQKESLLAAEEATGIKINWITVDQATQSEKVATLLAGDMPDMLIGLFGTDTISQNMNLFYDLSEEGLLETYAPDIVEDYNASNGAWDAVTWTDGSIRGLLSGSAVNYNAEARGIYYINKAWLDQLGLEVPNTTEELYDVLCAFRDNDMDGDGDTTNEIPFSFCQEHYAAKIAHLANFFGIAGEGESNLNLSKMVKDGEVQAVFESDVYREYLEYAHRLMEDGLLDMEGFSQSYEQFGGKLANGQVGVFSGWIPGTYMDSELAEDYVILSPVAADGYEFVENGKNGAFSAGVKVAISAETEHVDACLWWWNYMSSDMEINYNAIYGPKDEAWIYDEDGKMKSVQPEVYPEGLDQQTYNRTVAPLGGGIGPFISPDDQELIAVNNAVGTRTYYVEQIHDYINDEYMPSYMIDADIIEERSYLETEVEAYIDNFVSNSIMDGVTDESWETHLAQLEMVGYYEWLDWWQTYLDREF